MTKKQKNKRQKPSTSQDINEVDTSFANADPKIVLEEEDDDDYSADEHEGLNHSNDVNSISTEEEDHEMEEIKESVQDENLEASDFVSDGRYHNKQRCLILCSRGVTSRYRHLLEDLRTLIPHHKKDSKLDASKNAKGGIGGAVNDIAEMRGCNTVLFLECRKRQDAYLWISNTNFGRDVSSGPSAKFLVENIHTMDELRLTGNCMKGSRPILTFDSAFEQREELKLLKCLFTDVFGTPRGHPKSKPFVDRVMGFYYADGKIWVRNYQILEEYATDAKEARIEKKLFGKSVSTSLVEIGPRFVLNPIKIFRGSFGGQTVFQNQAFVSPNAVRSADKKDKGQIYKERKLQQKKRKLREEQIVVPRDPLADVFQ